MKTNLALSQSLEAILKPSKPFQKLKNELVTTGEIKEGSVRGFIRGLNTLLRKENRWSISGTAPKITEEEFKALTSLVMKLRPRITQAQELKGITWLRKNQWKVNGGRRKNAPVPQQYEDYITPENFSHFEFCGAIIVSAVHAVPVYRVCAKDGNSFMYSPFAWQSNNGERITIVTSKDIAWGV